MPGTWVDVTRSPRLPANATAIPCADKASSKRSTRLCIRSFSVFVPSTASDPVRSISTFVVLPEPSRTLSDNELYVARLANCPRVRAAPRCASTCCEKAVSATTSPWVLVPSAALGFTKPKAVEEIENVSTNLLNTEAMSANTVARRRSVKGRSTSNALSSRAFAIVWPMPSIN